MERLAFYTPFSNPMLTPLNRMIKTMRLKIILAITFALTSWAMPAVLHAVILAPGGSVVLPGSVGGPIETVIEDVIRPFSIDLTFFQGGLISGTTQDRVARNNVTGFLEFSYRILDSTNSSGTIIRASRTGFSGFTPDVNVALDSLGTVSPTSANRTLNGDQVNFEFTSSTPALAPGTGSHFFYLKTTATAFDEQGTLRIDAFSNIAPVPVGGSTFPFLQTFEPLAIPEPSTWLLFGSGLAGMILWKRKRTA